MIPIIELINLLQGDKSVLLEHLHRWELIPREGHYLCPKCSAPLRLYTDVSRSDGWHWRCRNRISQHRQKRRPCNTVVQFRTGTFFENSHMSTLSIIMFIYMWVQDTKLTVICDQLGITSNTAGDWSSTCREVLLDTFISRPEKLGGPGCIVEIYESKFSRRKYFRSYRVDVHCVYGGYERDTGRIFMVIVEHRSAESLLPVIQTWIAPGTTIMSDCWKAYDCLSNKGYNNLKVNNSLNFVHSDMGSLTNSIELSWRFDKTVMSSEGRSRSSIPGNLARYLFYKQCQQRGENRMEAFLKLAGKLYDPLRPQHAYDDGDVTDEEF